MTKTEKIYKERMRKLRRDYWIETVMSPLTYPLTWPVRLVNRTKKYSDDRLALLSEAEEK